MDEKISKLADDIASVFNYPKDCRHKSKVVKILSDFVECKESKFEPCCSFKTCRNHRKDDKCFEGHPLQCFV